MTALPRIALTLLVLCFCMPGPLPAGDTAEPLSPEPLCVHGKAPAAAAANVVAYVLWDTRVFDWKATGNAELTVVVNGSASHVIFVPLEGPQIVVNRFRFDTYKAAISTELLLTGYKPGQLHHVAGRLQIWDGGLLVSSGSVSINVRDPHVREVPVTPVAVDAQASPHVVNLLRDEPWLGLGSPYPTGALFRFYELYDDTFDFIAMVGNVNPIGGNSFYVSISNDVEGVGLPLFNNGDAVGSDGRLQGLLNTPIPAFFDLGGSVALHEIGHRWFNFLDEVPFLNPRPAHWPISTVAYGINGFSRPGTGGLTFPYRLTELENGDYEVEKIEPADEYNDFELYLMGLIPPESVSDQVVFVNQDQGDQLKDGGILQGPTVVSSAQDIIDAVGPRLPTVELAQKEFRVATIVLSTGRLLTPEEMAFFDHMAARGEARRPLRFAQGFAEGRVKPFYLATHRLATLNTSIP